MTNPNRLLLNMIVKNEAANLPRCLDAIGPHVIGAAIMDTGSTDDTVQIVTDWFDSRNKPCFIGHAPFEDFSQARNAGLRLARTCGVDYDYILLCDADMELVVEQPWPKLTEKVYCLMQTNGVVKYYNVRLIRRDETVEYVGATHECITPADPPIAIQGGIWYRDHETGSNRVEKFVRDIRLLKEELLADPLNSRSVFYMIQSLMGAGMIEQARKMCDFCIRMDGHVEERYWCYIQMAHFDVTLGRDPAQIEHEFIQAYQFRPIRAEPLHHLSRWHAGRGENEIALIYATVAAAMPTPYEILPIELAVYEWLALDNMLTTAVACKNTVQAKWAARALRKRKVPPEQMERITKNIKSVLGEK